MRNNYLTAAASALLLLSFSAVPFSGSAQTQIQLNDLSAFKSPSANWSVAGSVTGSFDKANTIDKKSGSGILVNVPASKDNKDIFTNFEHGDIDLSADFMMPKGSNSGIYLQGRYEIQLTDSWGKDQVGVDDLGAIYQRWDESRPAGQFGYEGVAPRLNVSRAPGLWQNIRIVFQAPKFDASGKKTANARIVKVVLNGVNIIENAELQGPTRGSAFDNEAATGPLRIQGDHGPVAFRNIQYNTNVSPKLTEGDQTHWDNLDQSVFVNVNNEPALLRSFVDIPGKRVTHAINVGYPHNISFSYDLGTGALFQVWKGGFLNASPMWLFRGDGNTTAIGSKVLLSDAPVVASLATDGTSWTDTVTSGTFRSKGYELDEKGYPTFKYISNDISIDDKFTSEDGKALNRILIISGQNAKNLYVRAATGSDIIDAGNGMYSVNNYEYYVKVDKGAKPIIRNSAKGKELLIPVKGADKGATVNYSIIW